MIPAQRLLRAPRAFSSPALRPPLSSQGLAPDSLRRSRRSVHSVRCRAVEEESRARATPSSSEPVQQTGEQEQEVEQLTTWKYGKTTSDKDLPVMYIALMVVPFLAMVALPFLPSL